MRAKGGYRLREMNRIESSEGIGIVRYSGTLLDVESEHPFEPPGFKPHAGQENCGLDAAFEKDIEFVFDIIGQEGLKVFLYHLVEGGFFGIAPLVEYAPFRWRRLNRFVHHP